MFFCLKIGQIYQTYKREKELSEKKSKLFNRKVATHIAAKEFRKKKYNQQSSGSLIARVMCKYSFC
jgi:hypothetical protein